MLTYICDSNQSLEAYVNAHLKKNIVFRVRVVQSKWSGGGARGRCSKNGKTSDCRSRGRCSKNGKRSDCRSRVFRKRR